MWIYTAMLWDEPWPLMPERAILSLSGVSRPCPRAVACLSHMADTLPAELVGNIVAMALGGVRTLARFSLVSKTWRCACRANASLLIAAVEYTGGVSIDDFCSLLGLWPHELYHLPAPPHMLRHLAMPTSLLGSEAVEAALQLLGGVDGYRARLESSSRGNGWRPQGCITSTGSIAMEEDQHRRTYRVRFFIAHPLAVRERSPSPAQAPGEVHVLVVRCLSMSSTSLTVFSSAQPTC